MGVDELAEKKKVRWAEDSMSIEDLREKFGDEAVNRGLAYMASLSEAEKNYVESADGDRYVDRTAEGVGADPEDVPEDSRRYAKSKWEKGMEKSGLGIDKEE